MADNYDKPVYRASIFHPIISLGNLVLRNRAANSTTKQINKKKQHQQKEPWKPSLDNKGMCPSWRKRL